jgi:uncharacterized protein (DUF111 family)
VSRLLYFDCFSGISGDMVLGALLDAGLPFEDLKGALGTLAVSGYHVHAARVLRAGVSATTIFISTTTIRTSTSTSTVMRTHTRTRTGACPKSSR